MAKATKSPKTTGQGQPTPQAPATGQATPPAHETILLPDGTIERRQDGQLVTRTPPPKANGNATPKPAAKGKPAKAKAPQGPKPGEAFYVAKLGTEDIWQFVPESAAPDSHVQVRHYKG